MVYVYGLVAACLLGLGFVLQQQAAREAPLTDLLRFRLLLDLLHRPVWLAGIGCMIGGQIFGVLALAHGDLSRVEPVLATNLLFAMALARRYSGERLGVSGWSGVALLSGGVAAFIIAGRPESGNGQISPLRHWLVFGGVLAVALLLVLVARHTPLVQEPPLLAAAAGVLYGLQDALTRVSTTIAGDSGVTRLLISWEPYVLVALAVTGLMLVQSAFEAGLLRTSLPALTAAEPLAGIACGIGFLGDRLRVTPGALVWEILGLGGVVAGVFLLGRHPAMPTGRAPTPAAPGSGLPGSEAPGPGAPGSEVPGSGVSGRDLSEPGTAGPGAADPEVPGAGRPGSDSGAAGSGPADSGAPGPAGPGSVRPWRGGPERH